MWTEKTNQPWLIGITVMSHKVKNRISHLLGVYQMLFNTITCLVMTKSLTFLCLNHEFEIEPRCEKTGLQGF